MATTRKVPTKPKLETQTAAAYDGDPVPGAKQTIKVERREVISEFLVSEDFRDTPAVVVGYEEISNYIHRKFLEFGLSSMSFQFEIDGVIFEASVRA
jgi:hypothetical protein